MLYYKYSQLTNRIGYDDAQNKRGDKCGGRIGKLGQLKLLMSEILFLSYKSTPNNKVVYAGASPGYHIAFLADMFPELKFELWDPRPFDDLPKRKNIKTNVAFFTDEVAQSYAHEGNNILFVSDIRNLDIANFKTTEGRKEYDQIIGDDNEMQFKWVKIMKPICAYLKFRPGYSAGTTTYFKGTIYLQSFSPTSTETRLMTSNYDQTTEYDNVEFDERMAYFNCYIRSETNYKSPWATVMKKYKIINCWDTEYAFYTLLIYLKKKNGAENDYDLQNNSYEREEEIAELFNEITTFLGNMYSGYDGIYEKK